MNHLRETLGKHSGSYQHCHPSEQSISKAETFQSSVQVIQKTFLKQFWWEYAPDICSSKNDYCYWALGTAHSFLEMYYENMYKYYRVSLCLKNIENLLIQGNTKYCKRSQKQQNYVWNMPESRRKEFAQTPVSCVLIFFWWNNLFDIGDIQKTGKSTVPNSFSLHFSYDKLELALLN